MDNTPNTLLLEYLEEVSDTRIKTSIPSCQLFGAPFCLRLENTMAEGCHNEPFGVFGSVARTSRLTSHKTSTSLLLASFAPRASKVRRMTFLGEGLRATSFQDFEKETATLGTVSKPFTS